MYSCVGKIMQYLNDVYADIGTETSAHNTSIYMQKQMQYVKANQMHHLATIYKSSHNHTHHNRQISNSNQQSLQCRRVIFYVYAA